MTWKDIDLYRPQSDFEVLVAVDDDVSLAIFRENDDGDYYFEHDGMDVTSVSHWMDKPDPPE